MSSEPSLENFAPEVLLEIFQYLTIRDRKRVRLTCSKWNGICNDSRFTVYEKLVWKQKGSVTKFFSTLEKTKREFLDLEFRDTKLDQSFCQFLQTQGRRIRCLYFEDCPFEEGIMKSMRVESPDLVLLSVSFYGPTSVDLPSDFFTELLHFERLTSLCIHLHSPVPENFVSALPQLQRLETLIISTGFEPFLDRIFTVTINALPHLRHLEVRNVNWKLRTEVFKAILYSQLLTLSLRVVFLTSDENFTLEEDLLPNMTLQNFKASHPHDAENRSVIPFLKYFRNLKFLSVTTVGRKIMGYILKYQTNLRKLHLTDLFCPDETLIGWRDEDDPFDSETYSLCRLKNLEYLYLEYNFPGHCYLTKKAFNHFDLPNLRLFKIIINPCFSTPAEDLVGEELAEFEHRIEELEEYRKMVQRRILTVFSKLQNVETLNVCFGGTTSYRAWSYICKKCPRLRYLSIIGNSKEKKLTRTQYKRLFRICPTLVKLQHYFVDASYNFRILTTYRRKR